MDAFKTEELIPIWEELHEILETMTIPEKRADDLRWLCRNIRWYNGVHPQIDRAEEILKTLLRNESL